MPNRVRNNIAAVILAGGASSRMRGQDKLMVEVDGIPLLRRATEAALSSRAVETIVTLCTEHSARQRALQGLPVKIHCSGTPVRGMAGSIRAGIEAVSNTTLGAVLLLPDMPEIGPSDIDALIEAAGPGLIVRAAAEDGRAGNPVLFPRELFSELQALEGDVGARAVVSRNSHCVRQVRLAGERALLDLDTPEQWTAWLSRRCGKDKPGHG